MVEMRTVSSAVSFWGFGIQQRRGQQISLMKKTMLFYQDCLDL
ncbi:hypothetical protein D920_02454 [Enterococcus faecalis 13-SD-W-01]|nr:hypothetical protein D920_02454 [Enterococcus faecalis 13-SD-W-01]